MSLDKTIHNFHDRIKDIMWRDFKDVGLDEYYYDYYYAEEELYLIRDRISECIWFIEARSPKQALESLKAIWESMHAEGEREKYE